MKLVLLVSAVFIIGAAQAMPAGAATASVGPPNSFDQVTIHYVADPGETNDVSFQFGPSFDSIEITDSGSTISAGSGCSSTQRNRSGLSRARKARVVSRCIATEKDSSVFPMFP